MIRKRYSHFIYKIISLIFFLGITIFVYPDKIISLNVSQTPLVEVLEAITDQTGYRFSYSPDLIDTKKKVSVTIDQKEIEDVFPLIMPSEISYKQRGNYIILSHTKHENLIIPTKNVDRVEVKDGHINESVQKNEDNNSLFFSEFEGKLEKIPFSGNGISTEDCHNTVNNKNEEKMKQYLAALVIAAASMTSQAVAQENQTIEPNRSVETENSQEAPIKQHKGGIFTFVYPLSSDWVYSINNSYGFSFNLLGGITGQTNGFEIGSVFNMNRYSASGVQLAGAFNITGFDPRYKINSNNVQISGMFNFNKTGNSTQLTGGFNVADKGNVQISGGLNAARESSAQLTGGVNFAKKAEAQLSGAINIASESKFQITGVANVTKEGKVQMSGVANIAKSSTCQIAGGVNVTGKGGFQLGVVNVRDTADGVSVGVINIVKRGGVIEFGVEGGEFNHAAVTFRSGVKAFYSILSFGYNFSEDFYTVGFGLGSSVGLSQRFRLNFELMHHNLYNEPFGYGNYSGLVQFRPVVNFEVAKHFKVFVGPTANLLIQSKYNSRDVFINAPYSMWNYQATYANLDFWVGFTAGFKF